jgi:hypothetical protein
MGLFDNVPPGSFPPGGGGLTAPKAQDYERTITRTIFEGRSQRVSPELEKTYRHVYERERTFYGLTDTEIMAYLSEGNAERGIAHLIDPYPTSGDTLH